MTHRRFRLVRGVDVSGVSGTGVVAEGVQFSDTSIALHWLSAHPTTALFVSIDAVVAIHGHDGATVVDWLDPDPETVTPAQPDDRADRSG